MSWASALYYKNPTVREIKDITTKMSHTPDKSSKYKKIFSKNRYKINTLYTYKTRIRMDGKYFYEMANSQLNMKDGKHISVCYTLDIITK